MPPFLGGGSMIRKVTKEGTTYADPPARFEAGTPAIAQAIGMAAALRWLDGARDGGGRARTSARSPTTRWSGSPRSRACASSARPRGAERLGPVSFELEGVHAHDVSEILDRHGVAVRAGHHCAQPLMDRLGVAATARASFGVYTTPEEIDRLVEGLHDARRVFGLVGFASLDAWTSSTATRSSSTTSGRTTSGGSTSPTSSSRTPTRSAATSST